MANEDGETASYTHPPSTSPPEETETSSACSAIKQHREKLPGLPRLEYDILANKTKLFLVTGALVLESSLAPVILFYGLWYGTDLRDGIIFAIITSLFGIISGLEFALRSWRLIIKEDTYRPLGEKRWRFDFTHQTLGVIYTILTALLVGASIPHPPLIRPLAMPMALFFIHMGVQCIGMGWMAEKKIPAWCRISSIPKGDPTPPLVLILVEDIVAVDGGAGKWYRERLLERYRVSRRFRTMIKGLNWFWGIGSLLFGIGLMVVVWIIPTEIAYGVGWGAPFVFAMIWTIITIYWTKHGLRVEKRMWMKDTQAASQTGINVPPGEKVTETV